VLRDDDVRVRLVAAQTLLDRGYGRPAQATDVTLTTKHDASRSHLAALVELVRCRAAQQVDLGLPRSTNTANPSKLDTLN
jgi:hypothetical protein